MNIHEVIRRANNHMAAEKGVIGDPDYVVLYRDRGKPGEWHVTYHFSLFYPEVARHEGVVDGGEFIVTVDAVTGEVRTMPIP